MRYGTERIRPPKIRINHIHNSRKLRAFRGDIAMFTKRHISLVCEARKKYPGIRPVRELKYSECFTELPSGRLVFWYDRYLSNGRR